MAVVHMTAQPIAIQQSPPKLESFGGAAYASHVDQLHTDAPEAATVRADLL